MVLEKDQAAPHYVEPPPGSNRLEWMTSVSPFVLLLEVTSTDAALTPDEDWVTTRTMARVVNVLKQPAGGRLTTGAIIAFTQDGGEATVSGTRVRAVLPWATGFEEREHYLVFASRDDEHQWIIDPGIAYKVDEGDRLRPLSRCGKISTEPLGTLAGASATIRTAAKQDK